MLATRRTPRTSRLDKRPERLLSLPATEIRHFTCFERPRVRASQVLDRVLVLEMVRVTEAAAVAASKWIGRGDNDAADAAAVEAMREALNELPIDGTVVIGEGERDEAPMLYIGEKVGTAQGTARRSTSRSIRWKARRITAKAGAERALPCWPSPKQGGLLNAPDAYMDKIAIGPGYPDGTIDLAEASTDNVRALAAAKGVDPSEIIACVLDRPRHEAIDRRTARARLRHQADPRRRRRRRDRGHRSRHRRSTSIMGTRRRAGRRARRRGAALRRRADPGPAGVPQRRRARPRPPLGDRRTSTASTVSRIWRRATASSPRPASPTARC